MLGQGGKQQVHTLSLPVVTVAGAAVVPEPGWLVRVADAPAWVGLVTGVQVEAQLGSAVLTVTLERHTAAIEGTVTPLPPTSTPLAFSGSIPNVQVAPGAAVNVPLAGYWVNGVSPRAYSLRSGALPAWLTLNSSTGQLVGTAPGAPETSAPLAVRATDSINSTADSNEFTVGVVSAETLGNLAVSCDFTGANGQTAGVANAGSLGGSLLCQLGTAISTAQAFSASSSLLLALNSAALTGAFTGYSYGPIAPAFEFEFMIRVSSAVTSGVTVAAVRTSTASPDTDVAIEVVSGQLRVYEYFRTTTMPSQTFALNTWHKIMVKRSSTAANLVISVNDVPIQTFSESAGSSTSFEELGWAQETGNATGVYIDNVRLRLPALT